MDHKFRQLIELGAGQFEHVEPAVIEHLEGTRCLLKSWSASEMLQNAGLYHVAYSEELLSLNICNQTQREDVAAIVGKPVEELIYYLFCCDLNPFLAQFSKGVSPIFYDRISGEQQVITAELLSNLCELIVAREIETIIARAEQHHEESLKLYQIFTHMAAYLSAAALRKITQLAA